MPSVFSPEHLRCDLKVVFIFHPSLCCPLRAARELQERISHQFLRQSSLPISTHLSTGDPGEGQARLGGAGLAGVMVRRDVSYDSSLFPRSDLQRSCLATQSCPTLLRPHGLWPAGVLCPWNSPGKNTGVGCHFLLQGVFPTQGSNPHVLHCRQIL